MVSITRRIVYLTENKEGAYFRYRVENIIEALKNNGNWRVECCMKSEAGERLVEESDLLIIARQTEKGWAMLNTISSAKVRGAKVLFDLDDLVFDYMDLRLVCESVQEKSWLYWMGYIWGIRRIARRVDGFICTNDFLAGKLKRSFGKPVKVIPNSLNREQVEVSDKCIVDGGKKHDGFVIGYFSGSPTHARDFAMVEDDLIRLLDNHDDIKLLVVGYMKFSPRMQELVAAGRVEVKELVDYLKLQELMASVDVNIAPLVVNDFTNCKSELKFFEAAAVETTTIASPTYTFKKAIADGENGFLAEPGEWYKKLEYLYEHPEENRKIALAAKKYALKHYYGKEFLKEVEEAYECFTK